MPHAGRDSWASLTSCGSEAPVMLQWKGQAELRLNRVPVFAPRSKPIELPSCGSTPLRSKECRNENELCWFISFYNQVHVSKTKSTWAEITDKKKLLFSGKFHVPAKRERGSGGGVGQKPKLALTLSPPPEPLFLPPLQTHPHQSTEFCQVLFENKNIS